MPARAGDDQRARLVAALQRVERDQLEPADPVAAPVDARPQPAVADLELGARTQGPDKALLAVRWTPTAALSLRLQGAGNIAAVLPPS